MIKNDVLNEYRVRKIIIQFPIGLEIVLFSKSVRNILTK